MEHHKNYETVTEATKDLARRGYTVDFSIAGEKDCLVCHKPALELSADDFEIDEVHRFEGMTDPGDSMIVYAISSPRYDIKGTVVNAYGMYADARASKIVAKLDAQQ